MRPHRPPKPLLYRMRTKKAKPCRVFLKIWILFYFLNIYLFIQREQDRGRDTGQRANQAPCRKPEAGLNPGSLGSHPGLQAALNRCATGTARIVAFLTSAGNMYIWGLKFFLTQHVSRDGCKGAAVLDLGLQIHVRLGQFTNRESVNNEPWP